MKTFNPSGSVLHGHQHAIVGAPAKQIETLEEALQYIADTPVCENNVRPWVRKIDRAPGELEFLIIAGRARKPREVRS